MLRTPLAITKLHSIIDAKGFDVASCTRTAEARQIVACVNGCAEAGITNPASLTQALRVAARAIDEWESWARHSLGNTSYLRDLNDNISTARAALAALTEEDAHSATADPDPLRTVCTNCGSPLPPWDDMPRDPALAEED